MDAYLVIDTRDYYARPVVHVASTYEKALAWVKANGLDDLDWDLNGFEVDGEQMDWAKPRV